MAFVRRFVGLDLGQVSDFTALAVLERPGMRLGMSRPTYQLRHLQRWPLMTAYPRVVQDLKALLSLPELHGALLAVDQTGVGRAVVDVLLGELLGLAHLLPVTITAGQEVTEGERGALRVPKKDLVGALQLLLQARRLQIASTLPDAALLVRELENFRVKVTLSAHETYEAWREGDHDDLVLAAALAAWVGERTVPVELHYAIAPGRTVLRG